MEKSKLALFNEAMRKAIEIETPKLKEGQTLKVDIKTTDEGLLIHAYPVEKKELVK